MTGVTRQPISLRRVTLTKMVMELPRAARTTIVAKKMEAQQIVAKWNETNTAKRMAKTEVRKNLTDFERFKVMVAQKKKALIASRA